MTTDDHGTPGAEYSSEPGQSWLGEFVDDVPSLRVSINYLWLHMMVDVPLVHSALVAFKTAA